MKRSAWLGLCAILVSAAGLASLVPPAVAADGSTYEAGQAAYSRRDFLAAAAAFAEACDGNFSAACNALGGMYVRGEGVRENPGIAAKVFAKACDLRFFAACGNLGDLYEYGRGVAANRERSFLLFQQACAQKDQRSCYYLGRSFHLGHGVAFDLGEASKLYEYSCRSGIADACESLGGMYAEGVFFERSERQAEIHYQMACTKGAQRGCEGVVRIAARRARDSELRAAASAGGLPSKARGSEDCRRAVRASIGDLELSRQIAYGAASLNDPLCLDVLGHYYDSKRDYELAYTYYLSAARKKLASAAFNVGIYYGEGYFVERDYSVSTQWLNKAIEWAEAAGDFELVMKVRASIASFEVRRNPVSLPSKTCEDLPAPDPNGNFNTGQSIRVCR